MADGKIEYTIEEKHETEEKQQFYSVTDSSTAATDSLQQVEYDARGDRIYEQSEDEKRLVRKLDYIFVMPFIAILNFLQVRLTNASTTRSVWLQKMDTID